MLQAQQEPVLWIKKNTTRLHKCLYQQIMLTVVGNAFVINYENLLNLFQ